MPVGDGQGAASLQQKPNSAPAPDIDATEIASAMAWANTEKLGVEAIREVQGALGLPVTSHYDEAAVRAVFAKQREWQKTGKIAGAGRANRAFFRRMGLILTHEITAATVTDASLTAVRTHFPKGVTVAVVPVFKAGVSGRDEFAAQASRFAANQQAVGLSGGGITLGVPVTIQELGDLLEAVQSIHRALLAQYRAGQSAANGTPAAAAGEQGAADIPDFTRVKNLARFSHGEPWGMGRNAANDFSSNGLHNNTTRGLNPANVAAFVRGLSEVVVSDIRVELFACSTGADAKRTSYDEWTKHQQGDRAGASSLAASLASSLGAEAAVAAHTTVGHTTENYAARVLARKQGAAWGESIFDVMYPEGYIQSELVRCFRTRQMQSAQRCTIPCANRCGPITRTASSANTSDQRQRSGLLCRWDRKRWSMHAHGSMRIGPPIGFPVD